MVEYIRANLGEGVITMHHVHHPEISVDGELATGRWYLEDKCSSPSSEFVLQGAAFYEDRFVRTPDGWRIAHTGYRRTFEVSMSTADLASYKVKRGSAIRPLSRGVAGYCLGSADCQTLPAARATPYNVGWVRRSAPASPATTPSGGTRIWGSEGERWFTSDDPVWRVNQTRRCSPAGSRRCCCSPCTLPRWRESRATAATRVIRGDACSAPATTLRSPRSAPSPTPRRPSRTCGRSTTGARQGRARPAVRR